MVQNRQVVLASRPSNDPQEKDFNIVSKEIDLQGNNLADGEILVKTSYVSLDPYLRGPLGIPGDVPRLSAYPNILQFKDNDAIAEIGGLVGGRAAGVVLKSKNPKIAPGDLVASDWKWTEYAVFNPDTDSTFEKLDKNLFSAGNEAGKVPLSTALGALGVSGSHAYWGYRFLDPKPNETLLVSSAAGNIGVVVSQIAKINGIKTIGIAGGSKANDLVAKNLDDIALDYRVHNGNVKSLSKAIKEACPNGIDVYFDNARGFISEAVYENLNPGARIYVCGGASQYGSSGRVLPYDNIPPKDGAKILSGRELMATYLPKVPEAREILAKWVLEGKLKYFEHTTNGFENIPKAFIGMLKGENFGKAIVRV